MCLVRVPLVSYQQLPHIMAKGLYCWPEDQVLKGSCESVSGQHSRSDHKTPYFNNRVCNCWDV